MSKTHFGFEQVDEREKAGKVAGVFHSNRCCASAVTACSTPV
jgi:hypothetical protein